jgi:KEOPS complex subunit Cgi121
MEIVEGRAEIDDVREFVGELGAIGDEYGLTVQAFDARYVADAAHLRRAVDLAVRERERGDGIADDAGVEILLYAAGRRQIDRALEMGVSEGSCPVAAVAVDTADHEWAADPTGERDRPASDREREAAAEMGGLLEPAGTLDHDGERLRSYFDVTDRELAATEGTLSDLVRERAALLVVDR